MNKKVLNIAINKGVKKNKIFNYLNKHKTQNNMK